MEKLLDYNNLAASLGQCNAEKTTKTANNQQDKENKEAEKSAKKVAKEVSKLEMRNKLMHGMEEDIRKGLDHVMVCKNPCLHEFIWYYFQLNIPNLLKKKSQELIDLLRPLFVQWCDSLGVERLQRGVVWS